MHSDTILVSGACGQIGSELVLALRKIYPTVIATDLREPAGELKETGPFERLDVLQKQELERVISKYKVNQIYHLAAILSATGEKNPDFAWEVNMKGLKNILDASTSLGIAKVFFPSTIAVFGPTTPRFNTPQYSVMEPNTVYGISKLAGERWADYYFQKKGLDIRSIRYPGLISYKTKAGGGTTDYAVDIYFEAKERGSYECFLKEDTVLPMMYMPDAIRGTIALMEAPSNLISIRSSYNFSGMSFAPADVAAEIKKHIPGFSISYKPDFRQQIAESWPQSIDDSYARNDWGWKPAFNLSSMTEDMLAHIPSVKMMV